MNEWDTISFVNASKVRFAILVHVKDKARTPSELANSLEIHISRVSQILKELSDEGLIKCLTPNRRKSKLYSITNTGKDVLAKIHELTAVK